MPEFPLHGGCLCGAVRYRLKAAPRSIQHCHCEICRKTTGEFTATGAVIARDQIEITGAGNLTRYLSSPSFERQFCRTCGGHLFAYEATEPKLMYFAPATLDGGAHPGHAPETECHMYVRSKAGWEVIGDGLPQYETTCPEDIITDLQRQEMQAGG